MGINRLCCQEFCLRFASELQGLLKIDGDMARQCAETSYHDLYDGIDTPEELAKEEAAAWMADV